MKNEMLEFRKQALLGNISGTPLCETYKKAWRKCGNDKEMLVRLALVQQASPFFSTACYMKLGLTKEYILKEFGDYINGKKVFEDVEGVSGYTYELYVGYSKPVTIRTDVISLMWHSGDIVTPETKCPVLYISNYSDVHLSLDGYNSIRVYIFDESKVTIDDADDNSSVVVFKYSNRAEIEMGKFCFANVKIFPKELKL